MTFRHPLRLLVTPPLIVAAVAVGACGSGVDQGKVKSVEEQGAALRHQGAGLQAQAARLQAAVASGKLTQERADAQLKIATEAIQKKASKVSSTAIDAVKDTNIPKDAKKQLQDAQNSLDPSTTP